MVAPAESCHPGSASRRSVLSAPVLLLNRHYAPVSVTSARRGVVLLFAGAAVALDEDGAPHDFTGWRRLPVRDTDDPLPIVGGQLRIPRVLHLLRYDRAPRFGVRLTRRNLLLRDSCQCQYCGEEPGVRELNVDHVVPRSRGGRDTWDNLVISCRGCNLRKVEHRGAYRADDPDAVLRMEAVSRGLIGGMRPALGGASVVGCRA